MPAGRTRETAENLRQLVQKTIDRHAALIRRMPPPPRPADPASLRRLLIDITQTARHDNKSGIQRVVRNIAREAAVLDCPDLVLLPVELKDGALHSCPKFNAPGRPPAPAELVTLRPGDVFLALDSGWGTIDEYLRLFPALHSAGVIIIGVVYDLIPLAHCHYFKGLPGFKESFASWIGLLTAYSRALVGISQATRDETRAYLDSLRLHRLPALDYFHLGFDRAEIRPPAQNTTDVFDRHRFNLLMVGTLEIRKGYDTALDAFDRLSRDRTDIALHIIGKEGWNVEDALARIDAHPLLDKSLFWRAEADDALLAQAYSECDLLIAASHTEGFGLPLIEAAQVDLPVVASDIPVFTEVAGPHAYYFPAGDGKALAHTVATALADIADCTVRRSSAMPVLTWRQSTDMLLRAVRTRLET